MGDGERIPETQFATLGDDRIAYQVFGTGNMDLLWVPASGDCIELRWYWPAYAESLHWLGDRFRVISFDRRGTGASDASSGEALPSWEQWADDARAVLDAVDSEGAVICGIADSGPAAILFAAIDPFRTRGLILLNTSASNFGPGDPAGRSEEEVARLARFTRDAWGTEVMARYVAPDLADRDPEFGRWFARNERMYMSPRKVTEVFQIQRAVWDVREALPLVGVPTLVLHTRGFEAIPATHGQYLAEHIAGARLAMLPGSDHPFFAGPVSSVTRPIEEFLGGLTTVVEPERALSAILFTDIVGSTAQASALGDREWRNLLETHDAIASTVVEQHRGRLIHASGAMGDGILATFDGPGRAIRCAQALNDALRPLGVSIRAGLHTGEIDIRDSGIAGIGVHIAARVMEAASLGELLVSAAVPMLVAGSGIEFDDRGEHELKGVPGSWKLFAVNT
jgi:class 3 adenylate cyclase